MSGCNAGVVYEDAVAYISLILCINDRALDAKKPLLAETQLNKEGHP